MKRNFWTSEKVTDEKSADIGHKDLKWTTYFLTSSPHTSEI